jgi:ribosome biogenesis GTPase / thiamine phosphate phosphatase
MMNLDLLAAHGWDSAWAACFDTAAAPGCIPGRVLEQQRGLWLCATAAGDRRCLLPAGNRDAGGAASGDWLVLEPAGEQCLIRAILPRRSQLSRQGAGEATDQQVLAANMDTLFLCMALDRDFNLRRLERILTVAWSSGAEPVIVLTKTDLVPPELAAARVAEARAATPAVALCTTSGVTGDGIAALAPWLAPGRTVALIGASGAGKSTLLNAVAGVELTPTAALDSDGKGRHTTTWRALHRLPGGALVLDNPGIRALKLWDGESGLDRTFAEIRALAEQCRFRNCRHEDEPGCAVQAAIARGELDAARLHNRRKLARELAFAERKQSKAAAAEEKHRWKRLHRDNRAREAHRVRQRGD